jgi:quinolinate synthase
MIHKYYEGEVVKKIEALKKKRQAIILAHNYQLPEVQDIADFRGDSLDFMAETASILSPDKKVIVPDIQAGCPMANMITAADVRQLKKEHPHAVTVGYVNTSAEVKAELDYCCTSSNAVSVINHLKDAKEIIFVPDKYLADYASKATGRKLIVWKGFCPTHVKILPEDIKREKKFHPEAKVMVHPECLSQVVALADAVLSTSQMAKYAKESPAREFIVGTEAGLIYRLKKDIPQKEFYPASEAAVCPNMKRTTQEKVLWALEEMKTEVKVSDAIRTRARKAIERMLAIT